MSIKKKYLINNLLIPISKIPALGEKNIDRFKVKKCLKQANAYDFIKNLEKGIDELISPASLIN